MLDVLSRYWTPETLHLALVGMLGFLCLAFVIFFLLRWAGLRRRLGRLLKAVRRLQSDVGSDPLALKIGDERLDHLWQQYARTLHAPEFSVDPSTGVASNAARRATVSAETIFNSQSIFEGRIHTEFFKHLPGLLTGLGIIGTFSGLITGLGLAFKNGNLDTNALVNSVKDAFSVSAWAIVAAMFVTFLEKVIVAGLHRTVEELCQEVDTLYIGGAGEEYLARLVSASESSASQAGILKDALVEQLGSILERLAAKQIEAAAQQQQQLQQQLVAAIDTGLRGPLRNIEQGLGQFGDSQGEQLAKSMQDAMSAFVARLDEMLGGQIGQARDLQAETLRNLEKAVTAFQGMAQQVGTAGENATSAMASRLTTALDEMATRQAQMTDGMRTLVDSMRADVTRTQTETSQTQSTLLSQLGEQMRRISESLHNDVQTARASQERQIEGFTRAADEATRELTAGVRAQTQAIEQASAAMRMAVADLNTAVTRNIDAVGQGAVKMEQAAERFSTAGNAVSDVLDRSNTVTSTLSAAATTLSQSSREVHAVLSDYRDARDRFSSLVAGLETTIETAKRDATTTSELVDQLRNAARVMNEAQRSADEYMGKVTGVLAGAHESFTKQMAQTVGTVTITAHQNLGKATNMLAETVQELDDMLSSARRGGSRGG